MKKKYDQEYKDRAAKYCIDEASSISQGAKDLGINKNSIFKWVEEYKNKAGLSNPGSKQKELRREKMTTLEKELREARKKNTELALQNEILKKALGILAQRPL